MEWYFLALILFGALIILLVIGMPIGFALGFIGVVGLITLVGPESLTLVGTYAWEKGTAWPLVCLPLFIFMAEVMVYSGIGADAFKAAHLWLGALPGGVGVGTVAACAGFAAACGSSTATATAIGVMSIPEMLKLGYRKGLATGATAAGGTLGILIPPSIVMVIYGSLTEQSIGHLFIAGIIPGIIMATIFATYIISLALMRPEVAPRPSAVTWRERWASLKGIIGLVIIMGFVFGTLYTGICTPTEVAGAGAFMALIVAAVYGKLNWSNLKGAFLHTVRINAFIFFILFGAVIFTGLVCYLGVSEEMILWMTGLGLPPVGILIFIYIIYIFLGMFLDPMGMMLLTLPFLFPVVMKLGYDPIWFGVVVTVLCEMGYITPPFGFNLYIIKGISPPEVSLGDIIRGCFPFALLMLVGIAIYTMFPQVVLYLPGTMG